jgi:hypothetical protein
MDALQCPGCGAPVTDSEFCPHCGHSVAAADVDSLVQGLARAPAHPLRGDVKLAHTDAAVLMLLEGRYRVERFIARGGMGEVFAGTDVKLKRRVAIKFIADAGPCSGATGTGGCCG